MDVLPNTGNNTLTIQKGGNYELNYNILMSATNAVNANAAVRRNGTNIPTTQGALTLAFDNVAGLTYDGRFSCSTIVSMQPGDVLELVIAILRAIPPGFSALVNDNANATMTVKLLQANP